MEGLFPAHRPRWVIDDEATVFKETASLWGIDWDSLPVLVVANDLWLGKRIAVETSSFDVEEQFRCITETANG